MAAKRESIETMSAEERAAMKEYAAERKNAAARAKGKSSLSPLEELLDKVSKMDEPDKSQATRIHEIVGQVAPELEPRTWYGMPAYAKGGKVVFFFQGAAKFKTRYSTLGFSDTANLDAGDFWPSAYAIHKLTPAVEKQIIALIKQAVK